MNKLIIIIIIITIIIIIIIIIVIIHNDNCAFYLTVPFKILKYSLHDKLH